MKSSSLTSISVAAAVILSTTTTATAFVSPPPPSKSTTCLSATNSIQDDLTFVKPDTSNDGQIQEQLCTDAANKMRRVMVPVSKEVTDTGYVGVSYINWKAEKKTNTLPLLLVHGFDSSALEYRRLGPQLAKLGIDVYCVDLLGWGYTQLEDVKSFSAQAKVDALKGFWKTVGNDGDVVVGGASLGGAATIEFASANLVDNEEGGFVRGTVLIDAQGFVDGIGPMSFLPAPLARAGIKVLKSEPLRSSANQMSYYDKKKFATDDALKVGRFHCLRDGWDDSMLSFMQSGGFKPATKVSKIDVPSLVLWGRQDGILDGNEFANKFLETLPNAQLQWIEECGHVPHLEQPEVTAKLISTFLQSEDVRPSASPPLGASNMLDGLFSFLN